MDVRRTDLGQALPLLVGVVAITAALIIGVGWYAGTVIDAARARTAADAAALAGALDLSRLAAASAAHANGGELVSFGSIGADVIVRVRVGRVVADARATTGTVQFPTLDRRDRPSG
ncbi:MAG: hypothetical protein AB7Q42_22965 [Acidimicrobiia bacterium]